LRQKLAAAGPEGTKTFMSLAQSIAAAEVPSRRINALFSKMGQTLKSTLRWQISSSLLHGVASTFSEAY
jgi:hypothetical protein